MNKARARTVAAPTQEAPAHTDAISRLAGCHAAHRPKATASIAVDELPLHPHTRVVSIATDYLVDQPSSTVRYRWAFTRPARPVGSCM